MRRKSPIAIVVAALLLVVGCGKGADLTRSKAAAFELVGTYGPKVSGLIGRHADLKARAEALPAAAAGRADVLAALDAQQGMITNLRGRLDGYALTIETAGKAGRKADIEKAAAQFDADMKKGIGDATAALDEQEKQIGAIGGAPPADPGAGSGTGTGTGTGSAGK